MNKSNRYKYLYMVSDFVILYLATLLSVTALGINYSSIIGTGIYVVKLPFLLISFGLSYLFIFNSNNLYRLNMVITRAAHFAALIKSLWYFMVFFLLLLLLLAAMNFEELILLSVLLFLSLALFLYISRILIFSKIVSRLARNNYRTNVLIVGDGSAGKMLATKLAFENPIGLNIIGFIDDTKSQDEIVIGNKKVIDKLNNISNVVQLNKIDEILIALPTQSYDELLDVIEKCQTTNIRVKITSDLFKIIPQKTFTEKYANINIIDVSPRHISRLSIKFKKLFDLVASAISIIVLSPLFLIIAVLVKLTSEGPVLFIQNRIGKDGAPFKFYKFRSMYQLNTEDQDRKEKMFQFMEGNDSFENDKKVKSDWRVTKIGKYLRKTSLDELPQLINVIKGEMSLVGPRPCMDYEYEKYENWQKRRLGVLPGCTGLWQVTGRSSVSFKDSIVLDLYYINNMSPEFDLQLIFKTIPVMLFGRGGG